MNNNVNFGEQKEVDRMALAQKRNPGCIITYGKEKTFFKKVNENRPTEAFWNECKQLRKNLKTESINALNALMDKED